MYKQTPRETATEEVLHSTQHRPLSLPLKRAIADYVGDATVLDLTAVAGTPRQVARAVLSRVGDRMAVHVQERVNKPVDARSFGPIFVLGFTGADGVVGPMKLTLSTWAPGEVKLSFSSTTYPVAGARVRRFLPEMAAPDYTVRGYERGPFGVNGFFLQQPTPPPPVPAVPLLDFNVDDVPEWASYWTFTGVPFGNLKAALLCFLPPMFAGMYAGANISRYPRLTLIEQRDTFDQIRWFALDCPDDSGDQEFAVTLTKGRLAGQQQFTAEEFGRKRPTNAAAERAVSARPSRLFAQGVAGRGGGGVGFAAGAGSGSAGL